jgi:exportin-2 (importin alpha re-exporter)
LFTEINFVLSRFIKPFLDLFNQTATLLLSSPTPSNIAIVTHAQIILVDIFYDFTCQDLPPGIEDAHDAFFSPQTGLFQRFMSWNPAELQVDVSNIFADHWVMLNSSSSPMKHSHHSLLN